MLVEHQVIPLFQRQERTYQEMQRLQDLKMSYQDSFIDDQIQQGSNIRSISTDNQTKSSSSSQQVVPLKKSRNTEKQMNGTANIEFRHHNIPKLGIQTNKHTQAQSEIEFSKGLTLNSSKTVDNSQQKPIMNNKAASFILGGQGQTSNNHYTGREEPQVFFKNSKVVRDLSNNQVKKNENQKGQQRQITKSNNGVSKKDKTAKVPLKDITQMIMNNIQRAQNRAVKTKTFDNCVKNSQVYTVVDSTNSEEPIVAPYGKIAMMPHVRVLPKHLSDSHNNSPRVQSSQSLANKTQKKFKNNDRENDINFYQDLTQQQQQKIEAQLAQQQSSFLVQPLFKINEIQERTQQNKNLVSSQLSSQNENVKSIECNEAVPHQAHQQCNTRLMQRKNQFFQRQTIGKNRGKSHNSPKDSTSLDRMLKGVRIQQNLKKFKLEKDANEAKIAQSQNLQIIQSLFEREHNQFIHNFNPLESHQITKDYRTKMVDWMIEVCTSFRCSERTWFLAVQIFDSYLHNMKDKKVLKNSDVHSIGIVSMYLASKYEDVYPINSQIAHEKISHKAISQKDILKFEQEFLMLLDFQLDSVTAFDFHQYFIGFIKSRFSNNENRDLIDKIEELSLYMIRMTLENSDLLKNEPSFMATSAIYSAISLIKRSQIVNIKNQEQIFIDISKQLLVLSKTSNKIDKLELFGRQIIEFFMVFDKWHCGMNQLKRFKPLSFALK